jgi:hypothetical protein
MRNKTGTLRALIREYLFISLFRECAESLTSENARGVHLMNSVADPAVFIRCGDTLIVWKLDLLFLSPG